MLSEYDIAVETFVNPIDLPLLTKHEKSAFGLTVGRQSYFLDGQICLMELWWRNSAIETISETENTEY
jgi:hypothetical protein